MFCHWLQRCAEAIISQSVNQTASLESILFPTLIICPIYWQPTWKQFVFPAAWLNKKILHFTFQLCRRCHGPRLPRCQFFDQATRSLHSIFQRLPDILVTSPTLISQLWEKKKEQKTKTTLSSLLPVYLRGLVVGASTQGSYSFWSYF